LESGVSMYPVVLLIHPSILARLVPLLSYAYTRSAKRPEKGAQAGYKLLFPDRLYVRRSTDIHDLRLASGPYLPVQISCVLPQFKINSINGPITPRHSPAKLLPSWPPSFRAA